MIVAQLEINKMIMDYEARKRQTEAEAERRFIEDYLPLLPPEDRQKAIDDRAATKRNKEILEELRKTRVAQERIASATEEQARKARYRLFNL